MPPCWPRHRPLIKLFKSRSRRLAFWQYYQAARPRPVFVLSTLLLVMLGLSLAAVPIASAQSFFDDLLTGIELSIGEAVATDVQEQYGPPASLSAKERLGLDTIFANITAQARRKEISYSLTILDSEVVNALAAPGGRIFLTTALLKHIRNDADAIANVLGHEVAHVEHKHGMNSLGRRLGMGLILQLVLGGSSANDQIWRTAAQIGTDLIHLGWSREQEYESDELGQRLAAAAGYDPYGMVRFFNVLQQLEGQEVAFLEFLSTHPLTSERVERAKARAKRLSLSAALRGQSRHRLSEALLDHSTALGLAAGA